MINIQVIPPHKVFSASTFEMEARLGYILIGSSSYGVEEAEQVIIALRLAIDEVKSLNEKVSKDNA